MQRRIVHTVAQHSRDQRAEEEELLSDTIDEPYLMERRLAAGGMAEVFVAKRMGPHGFEKRVALKRILPQFAIDADFVHMFIDEARLAARLSHANIVQVFDFGKHEGTFFIAMELIDGSNVNQLLRAVALRDDAVPLDVALHITAESAHALSYAHALRDDQGEPLRIVHRDVSPANLLLTRDGHVKLSDFGIARAASFEARTQTGQLRGKLGYMSPEQVLGRELDGRSDVFTLTTIFTEMLIAEPLFGKGQDLDVLMRIRDVDLSVLEGSRRRVPNDLRGLIERGLARRPEDRPDSATFLRMLQEVMQRRAVTSSASRLARLLARLELVESLPGEEYAPDSSTKSSGFDLELDTGTSTDDLTEPNLTETVRYRVRSESGLLGPMSYSELVELILSGHVDSDTMVSRAGLNFERAVKLDELRRFLSTPALQWRARELSTPEWHGSLAGSSLLPVVYRIARSQETGVLHLRDGERQKKIYFLSGRPDYVASTDRHELLGEHLVKTNVCLRMEVDMALAVLHRYDGRLGDALVGLGILRPMALVHAVQAQVRMRLLDAFHWRSGEWTFVRGARSQEETFGILQDPFELLRDAAFEADPDELESALEPIRERVLMRGASTTTPLSMYRLPVEWAQLIDQVNGQGTLASIAARESSMRGVEVEDVYRALYLGLSCELLRAA
ncbi:MAG: Serine/threonine protein kinase [Myxococcaceae bacterium]|nr:Serine/threonine protein kinase [Myxococcaceae bacterium]